MPELLGIDIETFSSAPLPKCGVYRYADAPDFEILLFSYAFGDGLVQTLDLAAGESLPSDVLRALTDPNVIKVAYNAQFERVCLSKHLDRWLDPTQWRCTAVMASYLTLPARLGDAARALGLTQQKMDEGKDLIRYFSMPCKPTKANGGRTRNLPSHAPEKWAAYKAYNAQDVETERALRKALEKYPLPEHEWQLYALDQRINDRGVRMDRLLVKQAMAVDQVFSKQAFHKAKELTGLENPGSVAQLKVWLADQDMPMESLAKKLVQEKAKDAEGIVGELLNLRLELSKTSVKKYEAMARTVCRDGRIHGLLQFGGASRTFRWAGRLVQAQNLPQNHLPDLALAREMVKTGDTDQLELLFGSVPSTLSELIRTALIPKEGCRFIVADFSAIEARVLAWLAGEEWVLEEFRGQGKIYEATAARMFHIPAKTIVKGHENYAFRQKGKQAVLSCIAEGELVLTDQGLIPIEHVTLAHRLWDGETWVFHEGVIHKGQREVIAYEGLTATPDHLVWVEGQPRPVRLGLAAARGAYLAITEHHGKAVWLGENHQPGETMGEGLEPLLCADGVCFLPQRAVDKSQQSDAGAFQGMPKLLRAEKTHPDVVGQETDRGKATLRESQRSTVSSLWCTRDTIQLPLRDQGRNLDSRESGECAPGLRDGSDRQQWELRTGKHPVRTEGGQLRQPQADGAVGMESGILALLPERRDTDALGGQNSGGDHRMRPERSQGEAEGLEAHRRVARLYDIRNAGPHHRFTVSGHLVHNCGYGGGVGALKAMGAKMPEKEMQPLVDAWRSANRQIVRLWNALDAAARRVVEEHTSVRVGRVTLFWQEEKMFIHLPSERRLTYLSPRLVDNRFGSKSIGYLGSGANGQLEVQETFGGKLAENITQAVARDLLAYAMLNLEAAGYPIVFHVHDECVMEVPIGQGSKEDACAIMGRAPEWADGLPLRADGYECAFYRKD